MPEPKFKPGDRIRTNNGRTGVVDKAERRDHGWSYLINGIGTSAKWLKEEVLRPDVAKRQ